MAGIDAADKAGLEIKLNAVALKGVNEDEFDDLIGFAHGRGFDLTLIETMPMGDIDGDRTDQYLPLSIVRARLMDRFTLEDIPFRTGGPARYVRVARDRRTARLHHADDAQLLRKLQPRAPHLHRHALYVPRPGRRRRPARAAAASSDDTPCLRAPSTRPSRASPRATTSSSTGAPSSPPSPAT